MVGAASSSYGQISCIPTGGVVVGLVLVDSPGNEVSSKITSQEIKVVFHMGL